MPQRLVQFPPVPNSPVRKFTLQTRRIALPRADSISGLVKVGRPIFIVSYLFSFWSRVLSNSAYYLYALMFAVAMRTLEGLPNSVQAKCTSSPRRAIRGKPLEREISV